MEARPRSIEGSSLMCQNIANGTAHGQARHPCALQPHAEGPNWLPKLVHQPAMHPTTRNSTFCGLENQRGEKTEMNSPNLMWCMLTWVWVQDCIDSEFRCSRT